LRQRNPTNPENLCWAVPALRLPYRSTQPTKTKMVE